MKIRLEEAMTYEKDMKLLEDWSKGLVEESNMRGDNLSVFGPCCTNGCKYCSPNCHEHYDSANYF